MVMARQMYSWWRAASNSWTVNLSNGNGFTQQDGKVCGVQMVRSFTGDLNGDGKDRCIHVAEFNAYMDCPIFLQEWLCTKGVDWRMGVGLLISSQNCTSFRAKIAHPVS